VYRPRNLDALAATRLPIVAWANGACANNGALFQHFLTEIASHGYFIVAIGPIGSTQRPAGPPASAASTPPAPPAPGKGPMDVPQASKSSQLIDAIDWAEQENARRGGPYFERLDTRKIAIMGQSCGGLQAIAASADPRTTATGVWNSGTYMPDGTRRYAPATRPDLAKLHAPVLYVTGDARDQANPNATENFATLQGIPVFRAAEQGVTHGGTYREPGGGSFGKVAVAWLDWQLKGDQRAATMFRGKDCTLCTNAQWLVQKKNID
jgi:dienelactone hydrolase